MTTKHTLRPRAWIKRRIIGRCYTVTTPSDIDSGFARYIMRHGGAFKASGIRRWGRHA